MFRSIGTKTFASQVFQQQFVPEHIKSCIDNGPEHIGSNQVEEFVSFVPVIPDNQENSHRDGKKEGCDQGNSDQSVIHFGSYNSSVPSGKDLFFLLFVFQDLPVRSPESSFPPGDQFFRKKSEKIYSGNTADVGPENSFQKTEFKLNNDQWEGRSKLKRREENGK
jgi:hypothetical protein